MPTTTPDYAELAKIRSALEISGDRWKAAGYPLAGADYEALEDDASRLRDWNEAADCCPLCDTQL